jgi:hypothetical protein
MIEPSLQGPGHHVVHERLVTSPTSLSELNRDLYGNPRRHLVAPEGRFRFDFAATVDASPYREVREKMSRTGPKSSEGTF